MMMELEVIRYDHGWYDDWDLFIDSNSGGTFLHSRRFLSYHGDRFEDCSLIALCKHTKTIRGVMPGVISERQEYCSHPGATFGGILFHDALTFSDSQKIFERFITELKNLGVDNLTYKSTPNIYRGNDNCIDEYLLWLAGAEIFRIDISSVVDLRYSNRFSSRRSRGIRRARKNDLKLVAADTIDLRSWETLRDTLQRRHNAYPVHEYAELALLESLFPENIKLFFVETVEAERLAYTICFNDKEVFHCQYIFAHDEAGKTGAIDFLYASLIDQARDLGFHYFSFGTSTEDSGKRVNEGLLSFKSEYGSKAHLNRFFKLNIQ